MEPESKARFKVVLIKHGYASTEQESRVITEAGGELVDAEDSPEPEGLRACEQADAILVRWMPITQEIIRRFKHCKIIIRYGVGTDNVDVEAATAAGIMVGHVPHYCIDEVSAHTIGLLLACGRNLVGTHQKIERGGWDPNPADPIWRIEGRTLGMIGFGNIGQAVARKLQGWRMRLIASDPYVDPDRAKGLGVELVEAETVFRSSDYLSLHVPLLPETRHLVNARTLAWMKTGALLINTARGALIDSEALLTALDEGKLAGAGLDVFEEEPLPEDSPLRTNPRLTLTDHLAWYSEEAEAILKTTAAEEAVRVCNGGLPLSLANPEVLRKLGRFEEWVPNDTAIWQLKRLEALGAQAPAEPQ